MPVDSPTLPLEAGQYADEHLPQLSAEDRQSRSIQTQNEGQEASFELAAIIDASSASVQERSQDFVLPARPSSTPFPQPEQQNDDRQYTVWLSDHGSVVEDIDEAAYIQQMGTVSISEDVGPLPAASPDMIQTADYRETSRADQSVENFDMDAIARCAPPSSAESTLNGLPVEIHDLILDCLFGVRVSATSRTHSMPAGTRNWATALRHARRRELSALALVSSYWRAQVQRRMFRHIKLKATSGSLYDTGLFFKQHPWLAKYVAHVELWFPVFESQGNGDDLLVEVLLPPSTSGQFINSPYMTATYTHAPYTKRCTLEEAFEFVRTFFNGVNVISLEGGERKKAPQIVHRREAMHIVQPIPSVHTLICKGQWNIFRHEHDFAYVFAWLPNLQEWHGSYSKPKAKSYLTMGAYLPSLHSTLKTLNLRLEADYRQEPVFPDYFCKVLSSTHFCKPLAQATAKLEHLTFTGRVCGEYFKMLRRSPDLATSRLKSVDFTVRNCCNTNPQEWAAKSGSGITNSHFIAAFEKLVVEGIRALGAIRSLEYLRIRYVDLGKLLSDLVPTRPY